MDPKFHLHAPYEPPLIFVLGPIIQVPSHVFMYLWSILILSLYLRKYIVGGLFPSGFPFKILCVSLLHDTRRMPCLFDPPCTDNTNNVVTVNHKGTRYEILSILLFLSPY
jgi:hypothetical protein